LTGAGSSPGAKHVLDDPIFEAMKRDYDKTAPSTEHCACCRQTILDRLKFAIGRDPEGLKGTGRWIYSGSTCEGGAN
jgi:hypothetical protein